MTTVLIMEDEPTINMILCELLKDEGFHVESAFDGSSGLKKIIEEPKPDLVIVDLRMPKVTGKEVVLAMQTNSDLKKIPIIIISGAVADPEEFPPDGSYQAVFSKPFDLIQVLKKVKELI